mmetsp:Transcript_295/g.535  ORF Transcript_295/g.535 Transcript_295/m.535 type:complete len:119 (+) Transcript_295:117-473(+)
MIDHKKYAQPNKKQIYAFIRIGLIVLFGLLFFSMYRSQRRYAAEIELLRAEVRNLKERQEAFTTRLSDRAKVMDAHIERIRRSEKHFERLIDSRIYTLQAKLSDKRLSEIDHIRGGGM